MSIEYKEKNEILKDVLSMLSSIDLESLLLDSTASILIKTAKKYVEKVINEGTEYGACDNEICKSIAKESIHREQNLLKDIEQKKIEIEEYRESIDDFCNLFGYVNES